MTNSAFGLPRAVALWRHPSVARQAPLLTIVLALIAIWYVAAVLMNVTLVRDAFEREETAYTTGELIAASLSAERPLLPAPHQIVATFLDEYGRKRVEKSADQVVVDDDPVVFSCGM